jgi:hypothetical protein
MNLFLVSGGLGDGVNNLRRGLLSAFRRWGVFYYVIRVSGRRRRSPLHYGLALGWLYDDLHFV